MLGRGRPGEAGSASVSPVARPKPGLFVAFCGEARDVRRTPRRRPPAHAGATVKKCAPGWLTSGNEADQRLYGDLVASLLVGRTRQKKRRPTRRLSPS